MADISTKHLRADCEVYTREYENTTFVDISVYKGQNKKPFYHILTELDSLKDISLMKEIGNSALNKYKNWKAGEIELEAKEVEEDLLDWISGLPL